jgi:hypothetical protein
MTGRRGFFSGSGSFPWRKAASISPVSAFRQGITVWIFPP